MIAILLGAGFSKVGGVPLASELFTRHPQVDRVTRERLVGRVLERWRNWESQHGGGAEEYLSMLEESGLREWYDAQKFVGLVIALAMGRVAYVGMRPTIIKHNLDRTSGVPEHEEFWSILFRRTLDVGVITTNYDVLAERGLRVAPRPRVPRPGCHYGAGPEGLHGGGYPSYSHIQKIAVRGTVPLLKLHGSVSWSVRNGQLLRYHDCRPAIRGDAAIVAPVREKRVPAFLEETWRHAAAVLQASRTWVIVGYSLPDYDVLMQSLLSENSKHRPQLHVFDPNAALVSRKFENAVGAPVQPHAGLPSGLEEFRTILSVVTL